MPVFKRTPKDMTNNVGVGRERSATEPPEPEGYGVKPPAKPKPKYRLVWTDSNVALALLSSKRLEVAATCTGPLAVHKSVGPPKNIVEDDDAAEPTKVWTVTHRATGLRIARFSSEDTAKLVVEQLLWAVSSVLKETNFDTIKARMPGWVLDWIRECESNDSCSSIDEYRLAHKPKAK